MRARHAAVLALLLVAAGCVSPAAPGGTETATIPTPGNTTTGPSVGQPTPTTTPAQSETTMRAAFGIDERRVLERVSTLLSVPLDPPEVVVSRSKIDQTEADYRDSISSDPFLAAFGLDRDATGSFRIAGYADGAQSVVMNPNLSVRTAETTLAHEFVHTAQFQRGWDASYEGRPIASYRESFGRGLQQVYRLVNEGTAEYVQYTYAARHVENASAAGERIDALGSYYRNTSGSTRLVWTPYYHGVAYVADRVDTAGDIPALYDRAPTTTEQVLHGESQATEPPRPLSVSVDAETVERRGAQGELFTRVALAQDLSQSRAVTAAAGWGNDTLLRVGDAGVRGFAWVTRWDTPEDATEFAAAMETLAADRTAPSFRVHTPSSDVVVVGIGPDGLLQHLSAEADGAAVSVALGV